MDITKFIGQYLPAPQFSFRWDVVLPTISGGNSELVSNRIIEIPTLPTTEFVSESTPVGNTKWYYALNNDLSTITMRAIEGEDGETRKYFNAWQKLILHPEGYHYPPVNYKKNIVIQLYDSEGKPSISLKYLGYFPTKINHPALTSEASDVLIYDIDLSGDSIEW